MYGMLYNLSFYPICETEAINYWFVTVIGLMKKLVDLDIMFVMEGCGSFFQDVVFL